MLKNTFEKIREEASKSKNVRGNSGMELAVGYIYATYLEYLSKFEEYFDVELPILNQPVFDVTIININKPNVCYFIQYKNSDVLISSKILAELHVGALNIDIEPRKVILATYKADKSSSKSYYQPIHFVKINGILEELDYLKQNDKDNKHYQFLSDVLNKILYHIEKGYDFDSYYFDKLKANTLDKRKYSN